MLNRLINITNSSPQLLRQFIHISLGKFITIVFNCILIAEVFILCHINMPCQPYVVMRCLCLADDEFRIIVRTL